MSRLRVLQTSQTGARVNNKCGAERTNGFASKLEASVYQLLQLRQKAGELEIIGTQHELWLTEARIVYKPDFTLRDVKLDVLWYCEAKGYEFPKWPIIKKLWPYYGPAGSWLEIWKGSYKNPVLTEVLKVREC